MYTILSGSVVSLIKYIKYRKRYHVLFFNLTTSQDQIYCLNLIYMFGGQGGGRSDQIFCLSEVYIKT